MSRLRIFLQTIRHAIFSHDSFMVFAIASLFYLVFYALPYDNQIIVKIPTAIVDMDQSRTSQDFTDKLRSAAVIDTVLETADFSQEQVEVCGHRIELGLDSRARFVYEVYCLVGSAHTRHPGKYGKRRLAPCRSGA